MDSLKIVIEGRALRYYPLGTAVMTGGTELYVRTLAHGLAERGHLVHVVTADLTHDQMRGPSEFWWGPDNHPATADVVIAAHSLEYVSDYIAPFLVYAPNIIDPPLTGREEFVNRVAVFTQTHANLLVRSQPAYNPGQCVVTGLGVSLEDYDPSGAQRIPGRMLYASDPTRGLWHALDVFDAVKRVLPHTSLHVTYDFERAFEANRWRAKHISELLWECKRRIDGTEGITNLGALDREGIVREQHECDVYAWPCDPQNVGSQLHALTPLELGAAGVPLVLAPTEAIPEVFGDAAEYVPLPGSLRQGPTGIVRVDALDWAEVVVRLMTDEKARRRRSKLARAQSAIHTWTAMLDRWESVLAEMIEPAMAVAA